MNRYASPESSFRSPSRFRICACTDTSSADAGSSSTASEGISTSARTSLPAQALYSAYVALRFG